MQERITTFVERAMTTVSNIDIESTSIRGNSVIKLYFQLCATFNQTC
jgi:multidrug efflux pump subunit AcrB